MTECNQSSFGFKGIGSREIVARFDGGRISSDGGALLLRETDRRLNLLPRLAHCFLDGREQDRVQHSIQEMVSQRIYGLALGYEDLNDHEQLRKDPLFSVLAGRSDLEKPLAGKSTLNRLELGDGKQDRYKKITFWKQGLDELLVSVFIESQEKAPEQIILDVDTTDLALHGKQEGRFFHGYYDSYCYLPLYIFCGEHVLCARLRQANSDAAAGSLAEIEGERCAKPPSSGRRPANRRGCSASSAIGPRRRRKAAGIASGVAEHIAGKENPRFVVTSLSADQWAAQKLYEELYCGRGNMENRIKEQFSLFADRVSAETMRANQMRLYLSVMAYVLVSGLRRLGLKATELAQAQVSTIRTKLLKIGAQVRVSVRKVWVSMTSSYPWQNLYQKVWTNLRC
jgi:hypothetical protein